MNANTSLGNVSQSALADEEDEIWTLNEFDLPLPFEYLIAIIVGCGVILIFLISFISILCCEPSRKRRDYTEDESVDAGSSKKKNKNKKSASQEPQGYDSEAPKMSFLIPDEEPSGYQEVAGVTTLLKVGYTDSQLTDFGVARKANKTELLDAGYSPSQLIGANIASSMPEAGNTTLMKAGYSPSQLEDAGVISKNSFKRKRDDEQEDGLTAWMSPKKKSGYKSDPDKNQRRQEGTREIRMHSFDPSEADSSRNKKIKDSDDGITTWMTPKSNRFRSSSSTTSSWEKDMNDRINIVSFGGSKNKRRKPQYDGVSAWMAPSKSSSLKKDSRKTNRDTSEDEKKIVSFGGGSKDTKKNEADEGVSFWLNRK